MVGSQPPRGTTGSLGRACLCTSPPVYRGETKGNKCHVWINMLCCCCLMNIYEKREETEREVVDKYRGEETLRR